jgi:hypothetical protein
MSGSKHSGGEKRRKVGPQCPKEVSRGELVSVLRADQAAVFRIADREFVDAAFDPNICAVQTARAKSRNDVRVATRLAPADSPEA